MGGVKIGVHAFSLIIQTILTIFGPSKLVMLSEQNIMVPSLSETMMNLHSV